MNKEKVAVVIISYRAELDRYEEVSLRQCIQVLGQHPLVIVKPASLSIEHWPLGNARVKLENFGDEHFKNIGAYSRLLLSTAFYKRFASYEYILIYQLDAFVFNDQLLEWCGQGMDYYGAPWFEQFSSTEKDGNFLGVGNGGFSLRKISSHLRVLNTFSYVSSPRENWRRRKQQNNSRLKNVGGFILDHLVRNNTHWIFNNYQGHEDQFWGLSIPAKFSWYRVPSYEQAAAFAFEMQPRRLYAMNQHQLPFGCHAWWKYDLDFWKPHIERFGYKL